MATVFIAFISLVHNAPAQDCSTQKQTFKWKSPDGYFSVETPKELQKDKAEYAETTQYVAEMGDCVFIVYVMRDPPDQAERKKTFAERIDGLQFMVGGDDDHEFSEQFLKIGKFQAKKIVYAKQNNIGLFVEAGDYIFVVGFASKTRSTLKSKIVKRFFSSFRVSPIIIDL